MADGASLKFLTNHITPEDLGQRMHIGIEVAQRTLQATTHQFIHTTGSLAKFFCTDKAQLYCKHLLGIFGSFYCDFLKSNLK